MKIVLRLAAAFLFCVGLSAHAQQHVTLPATGAVGGKVDYPALFRQAAARHRFKMQERQAVAQMDEMLVQQYASGRISVEKDAYLKSLYYQAATLLMNGYPIAGGSVIAIARNQPGFAGSTAGRGLADFVDAMLAGDDDEEGDDLVIYMKRTRQAQEKLKSLRGDLHFAAQLRVVGEIYDDAIAIAAGEAALKQLNVTKAEADVIKAARAVK